MVASDGLTLETSTEGDVDVITVAGEIDFGNVAKLRSALLEASRSGRDVEVRMGGVTFLDSTALGVLIQGKKRLEDSGHQLFLTGTASRVRRTLEVAGLTDYLGV